jgi:hypothetical protein
MPAPRLGAVARHAAAGGLVMQSDNDARLAALLILIEAHDTDYAERYALVIDALSVARKAGCLVGFRIDPESPEWPVAYIELPTGQVSWHMPQHETPWDGHDTAEKYRRCRAFVEEIK